MKAVSSKTITNGFATLLFVIFSISLLSFLPISTQAQNFEGFPEFGTFTGAEIDLKKVDFDKEANAVILLDLARATYNDQHNLITNHRVRIKILNDKGLDRANIVIPYNSSDGFEFINNVRAAIATYDNNNAAAIAMVDKKSIYDVKINEHYSEVKFTMPNVKKGSIIEYEYQSNMKHYGGLDEWIFQSDIPTLKSYYYLDIIPNSEFAYQVYKLASLPIKIDDKRDGSVIFEMQNIPGLRDEPYMDSRRDNLQRITFQLAAMNSYGGTNKYLNSWDDVARELLTTPELGGQLHKQLSGADDFIKQTKALNSEIDRLNAAYKFVQQRISWNGYNSKYTQDGIKKAWEKGSGTSGEINLILVNLLNDVNVNAVPLLASDRQYMKVNKSYPFIDQFNKVVTYVFLSDNRTLVIDASDKKTPINLIPYSLLNTYGYVLDKKKKGLVLLENNNLYFEDQVILFTIVKPDGVLEGAANVYSKDYSRMERKSYYKKETPAKYLERYFSAAYSNLAADSLVIVNIDNDSLPLEQKANFKQTLLNTNDYTLLNYHFFTGIEKNPFKSDRRFSDINFGSPRRYAVNQTITLPDNYEIDAMPKNITMMTPDTSILLRRVISVSDKVITAQLKLEINRSYYDVDEYDALQAFYKKMYGYLDEQIVLRKKK